MGNFAANEGLSIFVIVSYWDYDFRIGFLFNFFKIFFLFYYLWILKFLLFFKLLAFCVLLAQLFVKHAEEQRYY